MRLTPCVASIVLAACSAQSNPTPSPEAGTSEPEATAVAEQTSTPVETAAPVETAPAKSTTSPVGTTQTEAGACPALPKKKCQVTRGCAWNDLRKCIPDEGAP